MTLFAYGELCRPLVLIELLGRVPFAEPGLLRGFRRVRAASGYYVAVRRSGAMIAGLLLEGLDEDELAALDRFENVDDGEYRRVEVGAESLIGARAVTTWLYAAP